MRYHYETPVHYFYTKIHDSKKMELDAAISVHDATRIVWKMHDYLQNGDYYDKTNYEILKICSYTSNNVRNICSVSSRAAAQPRRRNLILSRRRLVRSPPAQLTEQTDLIKISKSYNRMTLTRELNEEKLGKYASMWFQLCVNFRSETL